MNVEENGSGDRVVDLCAAIITAYVSNNAVPPNELPPMIGAIHSTLTQLMAPPPPEPPKPEPPIPIRRTVTPDHIISLEDGKPYKTLKRHLAGRGLTPDQYRRENGGLPRDYPMVAANYASQRSELAKNSGLGRRRLRGPSSTRAPPPRPGGRDGPARRPDGRPVSPVPPSGVASGQSTARRRGLTADAGADHPDRVAGSTLTLFLPVDPPVQAAPGRAPDGEEHAMDWFERQTRFPRNR